MSSLRGFALAAGSLSARYLLGDALTQRCIERRQAHDLRRALLFGSFGATMGGPAYLFYAHVPAQLSRVVVGKWRMVAAMIAVDWAVFMPLIYLPVFYTFREAVYSRPPSCIALATGACSFWAQHVGSDLTAATPLLVTSDVVMFTALPAMWRVPFLSSIGLLWVIYISLKRGSSE
ncbi:unnamed protein product [Cladocopium goreaui]|uniref:Uncharacterized protein n=1 Tax=Cladocopium goreaui TaxID=2562237 RepID=A0A9P1C5C1_9DINO|nr:unnamed protein product [Cladocopium goreaui]